MGSQIYSDQFPPVGNTLPWWWKVRAFEAQWICKKITVIQVWELPSGKPNIAGWKIHHERRCISYWKRRISTFFFPSHPGGDPILRWVEYLVPEVLVRRWQIVKFRNVIHVPVPALRSFWDLACSVLEQTGNSPGGMKGWDEHLHVVIISWQVGLCWGNVWEF